MCYSAIIYLFSCNTYILFGFTKFILYRITTDWCFFFAIPKFATQFF